MDERKPDHSEDPRKTDTGAGYPEEEPEGAGEATQREVPPEREKGQADAPSVSSAHEGGPEEATGNRDAAG
ncbi:MAG TPA: hypothetical protein VGW11_01220 [Solirubrobacteraceae bacterium]|nr:hypothetical protein [Solirubrobacteraceae bacterium]